MCNGKLAAVLSTPSISLKASNFLLVLLLFLKVGDRIVSINGQSLNGLSHADAVNLLKNAYGTIILQV